MKSYQECGEILKAIAHPVRLEILVRLKEDGCNVSEIQQNMKLPQSTISQHLKILKNVKVISSVRSGTKICYKVEAQEILEIIELLIDN